MQDTLSKIDRYRKEANRYAELSKSAEPAYLGDLYRKVAVRYVFMAEDLLKWPEHLARGPRQLNVNERALAFLDPQSAAPAVARAPARQE